MKKIIFFSLLMLLLDACTSVPLKTLYKLSRVDEMTVDPSILRVALRYPNTLKEALIKSGEIFQLPELFSFCIKIE